MYRVVAGQERGDAAVVVAGDEGRGHDHQDLLGVRRQTQALSPRESASFTSAWSGQRPPSQPVTWQACRAPPRADTSAAARLREEAGAVVLNVTKVATGPMTEEEAAGIARFGDLTGYAPAIQKLAAI